MLATGRFAEVAEALVALAIAERDGRTDVRGYVRAYGSGAKARANYVAAYATLRSSERLLLMPAFPLPFSSLVGVLRFEDRDEGGVVLSSRRLLADGNEGMFLSTAIGPLRLPVEERLEVWPSRDEKRLQASHEVWVLGLPCFALSYEIEQSSPSNRTRPA